jgi:hypothetical protein
MTFPLSSLLHTRDAEGAALERAKFCLAADRKAKAQDFAGIAAATKPDAAVSAAREEFRGAARALAAVKLARSVEPATRFEA